MPLQDMGGASTSERIWGILGLAKLVGCSVLAVITAAEKVAHPLLAVLPLEALAAAHTCTSLMAPMPMSGERQHLHFSSHCHEGI